MRYNTGFLLYDVRKNGIDKKARRFLQSCKRECNRLAVGLFSDGFAARMSMTDQKNDYAARRNLLLETGEVDDVIRINEDNASLRILWSQVRFDLYFNGGMYGPGRRADIRFLESEGVKIMPIYEEGQYDSEVLRISLEQRLTDKKIVLFGTGEYFEKYMDSLGKRFIPEFAIDNDPEKQDTQKRGIGIKAPSTFFRSKEPNRYMVIICGKNYKDMEEQLLAGWPEADYRLTVSHPVTGPLEEYLYIYQTEKEYLDSIHGDLLKILAEFDRVCRENHLRYYVTCGSLIGVVRHHDFIPWDDDIDVTMPAEDFDRLKKITKDRWNGDRFLLVDFDDLGKNKFYDFIPRLLYMNADYAIGNYNKVEEISNPQIMNKAAMDIFILNDAARSRTRQFLIDNGIRLIYALCMGHRDIIDYRDYDRWPGYRVNLLRVINAVGSLIPLSILFGAYRRLSRAGERKPGDSYFEANLNILYLSTRVKKRNYGEGKDMRLRDLTIRVPENPDGQLTEKGYKNYMKLPAPKSRRPTHVSSHKVVGW